MSLRFTKMHGLGNDFVVFDAINQSVELSRDQIRTLADRRFGIGCDQLLLVEAPHEAGVDFTYRIFNADGGEVEQCGNGARCFARFVRDKGLIDRDTIEVATAAGRMTLQIEANGQVTVNMGVPDLEPASLPFEAGPVAGQYELEVDGESVSLGAVSLGNPHAVLQVDDIDTAPVERLGPRIEAHPRFPRRVNVGFMQVLDSGAYPPAGLRARRRGDPGLRQRRPARRWRWVANRAGLVIRWRWPCRAAACTSNGRARGSPLMMTGPATTVFEGTIEL